MSRDVCGICWCPYDEDGGCGCKPTQPEALLLADALDATHPAVWPHGQEAAAELRRLHEALEMNARTIAMYENEQLDDEALLRQALHALRLIDDAMPFPVAKQTIAALKERLE